MQDNVHNVITIPIGSPSVHISLEERYISLLDKLHEKGVRISPIDIEDRHITLIELLQDLSTEDVRQTEENLEKICSRQIVFFLGKSELLEIDGTVFVVATVENEDKENKGQAIPLFFLRNRGFVSEDFLNRLENDEFKPYIPFARLDSCDDEIARICLEECNQGQGTLFSTKRLIKYSIKRFELNKPVYQRSTHQDISPSDMEILLGDDEKIPVRSSYGQLWSCFFPKQKDSTTDNKANSAINHSPDARNYAAAALAIAVEDYLAPKSVGSLGLPWLQRIITGHWNRHHLDWATEMLQKYGRSEDIIKQEEFSAQQLLNLYNELFDHKVYILENGTKNSSSLRRVNFALSELEKYEDLAGFLHLSEMQI